MVVANGQGATLCMCVCVCESKKRSRNGDDPFYRSLPRDVGLCVYVLTIHFSLMASQITSGGSAFSTCMGISSFSPPNSASSTPALLSISCIFGWRAKKDFLCYLPCLDFFSCFDQTIEHHGVGTVWNNMCLYTCIYVAGKGESLCCYHFPPLCFLLLSGSFVEARGQIYTYVQNHTYIYTQPNKTTYHPVRSIPKRGMASKSFTNRFVSFPL